MDTQNDGRPAAEQHKTLVVTVRYLASRKRQYIDPHASVGETLAQLKPKVLQFFELTEGSIDGGTKTYEFAHDGNELTNLSVTLGSLAEGKDELKLDLLERFEQG